VKTIFFMCSGLGKTPRGFEAHVEDLFHNINCLGLYNVHLYKGGGITNKNEKRIKHIPQTSNVAKLLSFISGKTTYFIQNVTFFIGLLPYVTFIKIDCIYLGEPILCNLLIKWRKITGQRFRILFFTGGQTIPRCIDKHDFIHHVSPLCIERAIELGIPSSHQFLIPHFLNLTSEHLVLNDSNKRRLKKNLNIPDYAKIILSVGAIDYSVKRMDYIIREVSKIKQPVFLILLGTEEKQTNEVKVLAKTLLGDNNIYINSVPRNQLSQYYNIADVFVLASLMEGFGIVFIEALSHGIPVVAHDYSVSRYVLNTHGNFTDLSIDNSLISAVEAIIGNENTFKEKQLRHRFVYDNYSWNSLKSSYLLMFEKVTKIAD